MKSPSYSQWTSFFFIMAFIMSVISFTFSLLFQPMEFQHKDIIVAPLSKEIPDSFIVSETYDVPTKKIGKRNVSALFCYINMIEASYRKYGIENKFLKTNETVQFSEQALGIALCQICNESKNLEFCHYPNPIFSTENILMPLIFKFFQDNPTISNGIFPLSKCNYSKNEFTCSDYNFSNSQQLINFSFHDFRWIRSPADIKATLFKTQKPLLFTMPEPLLSYRIQDMHSDDSIMDGDSENIQKTISNYYPAHTFSGEYFLPKKPVNLSYGKPISFVIYGYNDDYSPSISRSKIEGYKMPTGGFIAKYYKSNIGRSIPFLMGNIGQDEDHSNCKNHKNPSNWIPKIKNYSNLNDCRNNTRCTVLKCHNALYCNKKHKYILERNPVGSSHPFIIGNKITGQTQTKMIDLNENASFYFTKLPFHMLSKAFYPDNKGINSKNYCGYWFIPYSLIERISSISNEIFNTVMAVDLNIKWDDHSFARGSKEERFNDIRKSTIQMDERLQYYYNVDAYSRLDSHLKNVNKNI
ncbi:hypothetical protein TRFO_16550 [Tritrichomonas foetus]|uniref:Uncharacterized protein n=1 Tax=Tritrichomonas foetus TaxID=1144522 RepID=A0A1J4KPV9_9EUKA|nr:hypothetical protein TRFO_16550 [Tritrichomonas foetus]|eukprot:OHT13345.1 hypothetical protein TRFO_16550 [Tritrichomonas foetus]